VHHVGRLLVCKCGARVWSSTVKVKVMQVRANGLGAVKDER
jgi:hypothetical protein